MTIRRTAIGLGAATLLGASAGMAAAGEPVGYVKNLSGEVQVINAGETVRAAVGSPVELWGAQLPIDAYHGVGVWTGLVIAIAFIAAYVWRVSGEARQMADAVFLDDAWCDGLAYGGCEMACAIVWKEAWLKRADEPLLFDQALFRGGITGPHRGSLAPSLKR
jgi:hypothetical protein